MLMMLDISCSLEVVSSTLLPSLLDQRCREDEEREEENAQDSVIDAFLTCMRWLPPAVTILLLLYFSESGPPKNQKKKSAFSLKPTIFPAGSWNTCCLAVMSLFTNVKQSDAAQFSVLRL